MGYFRRSKEERERVRRRNCDPAVRRAHRHMLAMFLFAFGFLFLMIAFLSPQFTAWLWQSAMGRVSPARDLLTGYLRWYWLLLIFCGVSFVAGVILLLLYLSRAIRNWVKASGVRRDEVMPRLAEIDGWDRAGPREKEYERVQIMACGSRYDSAALSYFVCAFLCFLAVLGSGGMLRQEQLPKLPFQAREDIAQIDASFLAQAEVWISPKAHPARLPGPYGEGQPALTTCYGIIGDDTGGKWIQVYVPDALGFSLDQGRLYDEDQSIGWNREHARRYRVSYTANFHLVTAIAPVF